MFDDMNMKQSKCLPYACNKVKMGNTDKCTLCHKQITDFHHFNYPLQAHGSDEMNQERHNHFVVFDPARVSCCDDTSGLNHRYAHAQCFCVSLHPMNEYIFVLRSRQICLRTNSYADPNQQYNTNLNSHMHPSVHTSLGLVQFISFQNPQYYFCSC